MPSLPGLPWSSCSWSTLAIGYISCSPSFSSSLFTLALVLLTVHVGITLLALVNGYGNQLSIFFNFFVTTSSLVCIDQNSPRLVFQTWVLSTFRKQQRVRTLSWYSHQFHNFLESYLAISIKAVFVVFIESPFWWFSMSSLILKSKNWMRLQLGGKKPDLFFGGWVWGHLELAQFGRKLWDLKDVDSNSSRIKV